MATGSARKLVVVLDDDPGVLKAVQRLLTAAGFDCELFSSGQDVLLRRYHGVIKTDNSNLSANAAPFFAPGQAEAATALQKELLEWYAQISRAWLDRVRSEVSLWSDLANKLSATKTASEAVEAYTRCVSERMQMAAEDGQHLLKDGQEITQKIGRALGNGWTKGSV